MSTIINYKNNNEIKIVKLNQSKKISAKIIKNDIIKKQANKEN